MPTWRLVRAATLFGISEGSARTALSRMVAAGEAEASDGGYRLVGRLVARQARQSASRSAAVRPWDGSWELASVDGDARRSAPDRAALRDALGQLRLIELREGLWGRPDNLDPARSPEAAEVADRWCTRWTGAVPSPEPDVDGLWDCSGWSAHAGDLCEQMTALLPSLQDGDTSALADGFVTAAAVLRHLQSDPLLPESLLPADWPGPALRAAYDPYDKAYRAVLRDWFRT
jgi:phenylacetic acid degradation operon negative regulatory protein